jgi:hypothetical protein
MPPPFAASGYPTLNDDIRQGPIEDRTFEIEFLDAGVHALDFTFGQRSTNCFPQLRM